MKYLILNSDINKNVVQLNTVKNSFEEYTMDDVEIIDYTSHGKIKMEMRK